MKKLNWLDKFAQEMAQKEQQKITKKASKKTKSKDVIVSPKDVPNARNGKIVSYKGQQYRVVKANYRDEKGPGVVLAAYEGLEGDPMSVSMGVDASQLKGGATKEQEYARTKLDIEQTYTNDDDAAWSADAASATEEAINAANQIDRTTQQGYYTNPPKGNVGINQPLSTTPVDPLDGIGDDVAPATEEVVDLGVDPLDGIGDDVQATEEVVEISDNGVNVDSEEQVKQAKITNSVVSYTKKLAQAMTEEIESSLEYAESVIKRTVPGRYAKQVLASLENSLDVEGIEVQFSKEISKQQIQKTASEKATNSELVEVKDFVNKAVVEDLEDMLEEADKLMDEEVRRIAKTTKSYGLRKLASIEDKMKSVMERKLKSIGVYAKFDRKYKVEKAKTTKKTK